MTNEDLRDVCRKYEIPYYSNKTKAELVKMITNEKKNKRKLEDKLPSASSKKAKTIVVATEVKDYVAISKASEEVERAMDSVMRRKAELNKKLIELDKAEKDLKSKQEKLKKAESKKKTCVKQFIISPDYFLY